MKHFDTELFPEIAFIIRGKGNLELWFGKIFNIFTNKQKMNHFINFYIQIFVRNFDSEEKMKMEGFNISNFSKLS